MTVGQATFIAILTLVFLAPVAQQRDVAVTGTVIHHSGGVIPNVEVEVYSDDWRGVFLTNGEGRYIAKLKPGTYWIGARAHRFASARRAKFRIGEEQLVFNFQLEEHSSHGGFSWQVVEVLSPPGELVIMYGESQEPGPGKWKDYKGFVSCDIATSSKAIPRCELSRRAVHITFDRLTIRADHARFDPHTQQLEAYGNVLFEDYDKRQRPKRALLKFTPQGVLRELE